ncbi:hypothetical protein [Nocardia wallacei]|uniref:hypothetical protein n=1 Tax=Nocardia wallacei TaxID=480035 RepID=UPI0024551420|nr:hypothetical protein [Nocardia wallacei]
MRDRTILPGPVGKSSSCDPVWNVALPRTTLVKDPASPLSRLRQPTVTPTVHG